MGRLKRKDLKVGSWKQLSKRFRGATELKKKAKLFFCERRRYFKKGFYHCQKGVKNRKETLIE